MVFNASILTPHNFISFEVISFYVSIGIIKASIRVYSNVSISSFCYNGIYKGSNKLIIEFSQRNVMNVCQLVRSSKIIKELRGGGILSMHSIKRTINIGEKS